MNSWEAAAEAGRGCFSQRGEPGGCSLSIAPLGVLGCRVRAYCASRE